MVVPAHFTEAAVETVSSSIGVSQYRQWICFKIHSQESLEPVDDEASGYPRRDVVVSSVELHLAVSLLSGMRRIIFYRPKQEPSYMSTSFSQMDSILSGKIMNKR